jgi:hypothetical protein
LSEQKQIRRRNGVTGRHHKRDQIRSPKAHFFGTNAESGWAEKKGKESEGDKRDPDLSVAMRTGAEEDENNHPFPVPVALQLQL